MAISNRPRIKIPRTITDRVLEIISSLLLLGFWLFTLMHYRELPETIPKHFNASGEIDGYGAKSTILLLPIIASVMYIGLSILYRYPHLFNYLVEITAENAKRQYTIATQMLRVLKMLIIALFLSIEYKTVLAAMGQAEGLGNWFLPVTLGFLALTMLYFIIKSSKNS